MKNKSLLIVAVLSIAVLFSGGIVKAVDNSALIAQLQVQISTVKAALIDLLKERIAQFVVQIQILQAQRGITSNRCYVFNNDMGIKTGASGVDLSALLTVLSKENIYNPATNPTTFNEYVAVAVVKFQAKYGILATGFVDTLTRVKLNALYGCKVPIVLIPLTPPQPSIVDNSASPAFPPIGDQGQLDSCTSWASTYYQATYETNRVRGLSARNPDGSPNYNNILSPKWANNNGEDTPYSLLFYNGAETWAEFPYDSNDLDWSLNTNAWRDAITRRPLNTGGLGIGGVDNNITSSDPDSFIAKVKNQLANGHIVVSSTSISSWVYTKISNNPSPAADNSFVGQQIVSYVNNTNMGPHMMAIVGYDDNIWTDLNGNGVVGSGEMGAFKIANSWGASWGNNGFIWIAYDAVKAISEVEPSFTWPAINRSTEGIFGGGVNSFNDPQIYNAYTFTARPSYVPTLLAEFTVNTANRGNLKISLGVGSTGDASPVETQAIHNQWVSGAINSMGRNDPYNFNGTTTGAVDGTFVFDFSDLNPNTNLMFQRYFLGITNTNNSSPNVPIVLKSFKLTDASGRVLLTSGDVPIAINNQTVWSHIDVPSIAIISPNGGETLIQGQLSPITWTSTNVSTVFADLVPANFPGNGIGTLGMIGFVSSGNAIYWDAKTVYSDINNLSSAKVIPPGQYKIHLVGNVANVDGQTVNTMSANYFTIVASGGGGGGGATPPIVASCAPSFPSAKVGDTVRWIVTASGGRGSFTYHWSGYGTADNPGANAFDDTIVSATEGVHTEQLTVTDPEGHSATASCSVTVMPTTIASCSASSNPVPQYQPVTWTATPGQGNTYDWGPVKGASNIYVDSNVSATPGTYTQPLTVTGPAGTATTTCSVVVNPFSPPVITMNADSTQLSSGQTATISWSATDAASCQGSTYPATDLGWNGPQNTSGFYVYPPSVWYAPPYITLILTCDGPGGSSTQSVFIQGPGSVGLNIRDQMIASISSAIQGIMQQIQAMLKK